MEKITVAVLRTQGGWRVMKDDRQIGEYDFRVDAEDAGLKLTRQIHLSGRDVELLVQTDVVGVGAFMGVLVAGV